MSNGQEIVEESLIKQVAAYRAAGMSLREVGKLLNMTHQRIHDITNKEECKAIVRRIGEEAVLSAVTKVKSEVAELSPLLVATLRKHLENGNLQAVAPTLKILGFDAKEAVKETPDSTVIIQLPSMPNEPINVTPKRIG